MSDFKTHLERETAEKIVSFNGFRLVTETTVYGIAFGELICEVNPSILQAAKKRLANAKAQPLQTKKVSKSKKIPK